MTRFRDFWRGEPSVLSELASRLTGSSDLYEHSGRRPMASINFVTAHDGFTMRDLVSYNEKHNEANGEGGNDGESHNRSWNCGTEGPTDDPKIQQLRLRQVRNFITTLLISQGVPMISHGDELGRTQKGNNNTYCQDNELAWVNWDLSENQEDLLEFTKKMIEFRADHPVLRRRRFFSGGSEHGGESHLGEIEWLVPSGDRMQDEDWNTWFAKSVMIYLNGAAIPEPNYRGQKIEDDDLLLLISADASEIDFTLPGANYGMTWHEAINTADPGADPHVFEAGETVTVEGRSIIILVRTQEEREEEISARTAASAEEIAETESDSANGTENKAKSAADSEQADTDKDDDDTVTAEDRGAGSGAEPLADGNPRGCTGNQYPARQGKSYDGGQVMSEKPSQTYAPSHTHTPGEGRRAPVSTYRLQLGPDLTFSQARELLPYLSDLGITDVYCSPILQAAPGSTHGYDVTDHSTISQPMGGEAAFRKFTDKAHELGMGIIVDVVPNHMAVPTPLYLNKALWSVLKYGPNSEYHDWFDIELEEDGEGLLMPMLGSRIGAVLANGELNLETMVVPGLEDEGEQHVLTYYDYVFPVRDQTESLPLAELVDRQFYRLAYWKVANEELNYRRFFDVDTLAAVRVEDKSVFDATHELLLQLFDEGHIDGFRIDHPDGLADPRGYFRQLSEATGGAWVAAEKILDGDEELPDDWPIAGTTGYDTAWRIQALQTDPAGLVTLGSVLTDIAGDSPGDLPDIIMEGKEEIIRDSLFTEVDRLAHILSELCQEDVRLRDHTFRALRDSVVALLLEMDRYRAYVVPGERPSQVAEKALRDAAERAKKRLAEDRHETLEIVVELLLGAEIGSAGRTHEAQRAELIIRFQQTCGPVMAKGMEDTAWYRWTLLTSSCEVGSYAVMPTYSADQFHAWVQKILPSWPMTMTAGTTHDTKRGEDVRARISVLSQYSTEWSHLLEDLRGHAKKQRPANLDGRTQNLLWQTIFGTWTADGPIEHERLVQYLEKASREQKTWTTWTEPDEDAEKALFLYARYLITVPVHHGEAHRVRGTHCPRSPVRFCLPPRRSS